MSEHMYSRAIKRIEISRLCLKGSQDHHSDIVFCGHLILSANVVDSTKIKLFKINNPTAIKVLLNTTFHFYTFRFLCLFVGFRN